MVLACSMKKDDKTVSDGLVCEQLLVPKSSQTDEKWRTFSPSLWNEVNNGKAKREHRERTSSPKRLQGNGGG